SSFMNKVALLKVKIFLSTNSFEIRPVDFISKSGRFVIALSSFTITGNSRIDAMRRSFPQNYKTLCIYPNMSKGNFSMP
ncbi:MAG: hypothetical protein ACK6BZ_01345, partial [Candidatus Kapaibacterium sp.]